MSVVVASNGGVEARGKQASKTRINLRFHASWLTWDSNEDKIEKSREKWEDGEATPKKGSPEDGVVVGCGCGSDQRIEKAAVNKLEGFGSLKWTAKLHHTIGARRAVKTPLKQVALSRFRPAATQTRDGSTWPEASTDEAVRPSESELIIIL
jgi:hypothetical protein